MIKSIDKLINHCDVRENKDLTKLYQLTTSYLQDNVNYVFSRQYEDVRKLRRTVYSQMVYNLDENKSAYSNYLSDIKKYLASQRGTKSEFNSTTMNKIEEILRDPAQPDALKLANIQFLARDYNSLPMHNLKRKLSHFFDSDKEQEGNNVKEFCQMIGKANFAFADNPNSEAFIGWLNDKVSNNDNWEAEKIQKASDKRLSI